MSFERQPHSNVQKIQSRCRQVDTHELMKDQLRQQSSSQESNYRLGIPIAPKVISGGALNGIDPDNVGFEEDEILFDSIYRDTTSDYSVGEMNFSIPIFNQNKSIESVVEITVGSFFFPTVPTLATRPDFYYHRRIYMEITSAPSTQAVQCANNTRYHFEFDVANIGGPCVYLTPINYKPYFFKRPQNTITDFQLRFYVPQTLPINNPMKRIPLPLETVQVTNLLTGGVGYNPIRFQIITPSTDTTILGLVGALTPSPGVAVWITGFTSNDPATNALVNDSAGLFATTVIDNTTFEIAGIDSTAVTGNYTASVYIAKNNVRIPVRFTRVTQTPTNFVRVEHT